jgi:hypothetical protein
MSYGQRGINNRLHFVQPSSIPGTSQPTRKISTIRPRLTYNPHTHHLIATAPLPNGHPSSFKTGSYHNHPKNGTGQCYYDCSANWCRHGKCGRNCWCGCLCTLRQIWLQLANRRLPRKLLHQRQNMGRVYVDRGVHSGLHCHH